MYHRFTGYIGNLKSIPLGKLLATHPERAIEIAVKGMLPKNPLGRAMFRKLKVLQADAEHPHTAQQPQALTSDRNKQSWRSQNYGTGRRKSSAARVFLRPGKGQITVNDRRSTSSSVARPARMIVRQPLELTKLTEPFDVLVHGRRWRHHRPGRRHPPRHHPRAGRVRRERCKSPLRKAGFVTRDAREVERKKVGLHKARRATQYSKR
jgi:small subunit ribosomal protein S9